MLGLRKKEVKKEIIVNAESLETRVAVLEDGELEDFFVERPTEDRIVGSIFKGKIQNLEDGLQAAFVDIGHEEERLHPLLGHDPGGRGAAGGRGGRRARPRGRARTAARRAKWPSSFPVGSEIVVQVTKGAIGTKGPRVTANLSIPGRFLVMMPGSTLKGVSRKIEDRQGAPAAEEGPRPPAHPPKDSA